MQNTVRTLLITLLCALLCACGFFDKDNTPPPSPLVNFTPEANVQSLWYANTGSGADGDYIKLVPALANSLIFTANQNGQVTATDKIAGRNLWKTDTRMTISAGPGAGDGIVLVGGQSGEVIALSQAEGRILWKTRVSSEVLAAPAVGRGIVLVKSIDGRLVALSEQDGHALWHFQQIEPSLILRGASTPKISENSAIVGFANGKLNKLGLQEGNLRWQQTIATPEGTFAIQRLVDIDADPIIFSNHIYAATYQGKIAALYPASGNIIWTNDTSSYAGIAADDARVYVSDAQSHVTAFDADSGHIMWRQMQLAARNITGPATLGNYVVVGDDQGYLHWLSKQDGHFVARVKVNSQGIIATPVVDNRVLYVLTKNGYLAAYTIRP